MRSDELGAFLKQYDTYVREILVPTRDEIKGVFKTWREPRHWAPRAKRTRLPAPSPIQRAFPRIKRPESVVDKILRKPSNFPDGITLRSAERMYDAVAGRVVVYFLANLPLLDREIRESEILEIHPTEVPIAYLGHDLTQRLGLAHMQQVTKDSGYASVHYIVRLRSSRVAAERRPWFEIQVRTLAEDVWGEIEHILGYKPEKRTSFAVRKQFQIIGSQLAAIDEHFNLLFEELSRFQEEVTPADNNPLNAENLPPVLDELGIGCAQKEIDGLLKLLASRGFSTVGDLRAGGTTRRVEIVRNAYRSIKGQTPGNFDIVAGIAAMRGLNQEQEMIGALKAQIEFLDAWEKLRREVV